MAQTPRLLYDGESQFTWNLIHIWSLTSISLSLLGELYVLLKTYQYLRQTNKPLDFSHKLPAAIALSDFIFSIHHGVDHMLSLVTGYVPSGALCDYLGFAALWGLDSTALWSFVLAVYMSSMVLFGIKLDFDNGFKWWGVTAFAIGVPFIANVVMIPLGLIDNAGMFCMVTDKTASIVLKPGLFLSVFFFIALCYVAIGITLATHVRRVERSLLDSEGGSEGSSTGMSARKVRRIGLRLVGFTVVYMLQFFPVCIIVFTVLVKGKPGLVVNILDKVMSNGNGWMNAVAYWGFVGQGRRKNGERGDVREVVVKKGEVKRKKSYNSRKRSLLVVTKETTSMELLTRKSPDDGRVSLESTMVPSSTLTSQTRPRTAPSQPTPPPRSHSFDKDKISPIVSSSSSSPVSLSKPLPPTPPEASPYGPIFTPATPRTRTRSKSVSSPFQIPIPPPPIPSPPLIGTPSSQSTLQRFPTPPSQIPLSSHKRSKSGHV